MSTLPLAVHTAAQVRALDRHAIDDLQIPSYTLMTRAGEAALGAAAQLLAVGAAHRVVCGPGNNGGDGYVLARLAREQRLEVAVVGFTSPRSLQGDARRAYDDFVAAGGSVERLGANCLRRRRRRRRRDLRHRPVAAGRPAIARKPSQRSTRCGAPVLALDIPSGLHADTGEVLGAAVRAERTLTFVGLKLGFYLGEGPELRRRRHVR